MVMTVYSYLCKRGQETKVKRSHSKHKLGDVVFDSEGLIWEIVGEFSDSKREMVVC